LATRILSSLPLNGKGCWSKLTFFFFFSLGLFDQGGTETFLFIYPAARSFSKRAGRSQVLFFPFQLDSFAVRNSVTFFGVTNQALSHSRADAQHFSFYDPTFSLVVPRISKCFWPFPTVGVVLFSDIQVPRFFPFFFKQVFFLFSYLIQRLSSSNSNRTRFLSESSAFPCKQDRLDSFRRSLPL